MKGSGESEKKRSRLKSKLDYAKLTFILSFIGFLGSIGFYFGVLRQVYGNTQNTNKIEELKVENESLKQTLFVLTDKLQKDA